MRAWVYLKIENPMVAWLAYRGEIYSTIRDHPSALSMVAADRLRGATRGSDLLRVEVAIEVRRRAAYSAQASRLAGFYAFVSEADAARAARKWNISSFTPDNLTELDVSDDSLVTFISVVRCG